MTRSPRSSPERRFLPAFFLAGAALLHPPPAGAQAAAAGVDEVQARARAVLADPRFQRELPAHSGEPRASRRTGVFRGGEMSPELPVAVPVIGAGAQLARIVFVILAAVALLLLFGWLGGEVVARRRRARERPAAGAAVAVAARVSERDPTFDEAARLAAQGLHAEAIHALLLAAIRHAGERSRTPVPPFRTSRELLRLLPLGAESREAFAELVKAVELSLFGGVPAGPADFERSLSQFRRLTGRPA